jgi:hypothetical protein
LGFTDSSVEEVDNTMFSLVDALFVGRLEFFRNLNESLDFLSLLTAASGNCLEPSSPSGCFIVHSTGRISL